MIELHNMDCMELMRRYPDDYFDLAIVDPPYGIGEDGKSNHSRSRLAKSKLYTPKNWDSFAPPNEYFIELKRVAKEVIIWGANHFIENIPEANTSSWVVWDKKNGQNDFADCELAYTTHNKAVRVFRYRWHGMLQEDMKNKEQRIHPTQKPIALYRWLLENYAKQGDMYSRKTRILDTHLGSGSSAIAAYQLGYDFVGCELDKDYFQAMQKRVKQAMKQTNLFQSAEEKQAEQIKIF